VSVYRRYALVAIVAVLLVAAALVWLLDLRLYFVWLVAMSVVTFAAYGFDKRQAAAGGERVPELVLHGLALAGGVVGGWLGRAAFRHKTRHLSFTLVLSLATLLYAALTIWLYVDVW
jgi:uncharacterized membrane protein YsdA (DUF1294 family)